MKVNQHNLLQTLTSLKLEAKVQQETNQITLFFEDGDHQYPLFLRELHDGELLQLLTFIPRRVEPENILDLGRLLHMLNKELDMPGFCLDEGSLTVFYRLMLPTIKKEYDPKLFETLINTSQMVIKSFGPVVEALAIGAMSLSEILKKANELKSANEG